MILRRMRCSRAPFLPVQSGDCPGDGGVLGAGTVDHVREGAVWGSGARPGWVAFVADDGEAAQAISEVEAIAVPAGVSVAVHVALVSLRRAPPSIRDLM